jgi:hypothetical protein
VVYFALEKSSTANSQAVAFGHADAGGVHVGVEDVGAALRRLHEALMNGGGVRSLVDVLENPLNVGSTSGAGKNSADREPRGSIWPCSSRTQALRCKPSSSKFSGR